MSTPGVINFPTLIDDIVSLGEANNNASTTLTAGITSSTILIPIADPNEFPASGFATLTDSITPWVTPPTKLEVIRYTTKSGSNLSLGTSANRGLFGTTAQSWNSGQFVEQRLVARYMTGLRDAIIAMQNEIITVRHNLIVVTWGTPTAESNNKREITATCTDIAGFSFTSSLVDIEVAVSNGLTDPTPSLTATIEQPITPIGTILSGVGTASAIIRTNSSGQVNIAVRETGVGSRFLWTNNGGQARLWIKASAAPVQLTYV